MIAPRLLALATLPLVVTLAATGCDVVRWRQGRLESAWDRMGLLPGEARIGGATVGYREGGDGPPVLLLHGFGATSIWQWERQARSLLRAGRRVVVPDLLWFGASTGGEGEYGLDDQARAVLGLADHLGIARFDVVGMSYGGFVAWTLAAAHPERVGRLVMATSPGPAFRPEDLDALRERLGVGEPGEVFVPEDPARVQDLVDLATTRPPRLPGFARRQVLRAFYTSGREHKLRLLAALHAAVGAPGAAAPRGCRCCCSGAGMTPYSPWRWPRGCASSSAAPPASTSSAAATPQTSTTPGSSTGPWWSSWTRSEDRRGPASIPRPRPPTPPAASPPAPGNAAPGRRRRGRGR